MKPASESAWNLLCRSKSDDARVQKTPARFPRLGKWLTVCCWLNFVMLVGVWLLFRFAGDRWWLATALLYGPRWIWGVPLILLAPASLLVKRRCMWIVLASGLVLLFPVMGFVISLGPFRGTPTGEVIRVLNCNVDGGSMNDQAMARLIADTHPDIIACQEFPGGNETLSPVLSRLGWHIHKSGELFLASQFPIVSVEAIPTVEGWRTLACIYVLQTPAGNINFINLHLETPRKGLEFLLQGRRSQIEPIYDNMARRARESELVSLRAKHLRGPTIVAGDFNLPSDSAIFRENWSDFSDGFAVGGFGFGATKLTQKWGIRIDHLLANNLLQVWHSHVGPDVGSDHLPVLTELGL